MAELVSSSALASTTGSSPSLQKTNNEISNPFIVGQLVEVESRTWPGMNQQGGVGRVTGIAANRVSVRYLVGHTRHEKEIPVRFVKGHAPAAKRLRDRSMLLGRCQNCGSLRTDCGSCDFWAAAEQQQRQRSKVNGESARTEQIQKLETNDDTDSDDSSSSTSSFERDIARQRRGFRRYQRIKKRALQILTDNGDGNDTSSSNGEKESESSSDDDDDLPLKHLVWQESQSIMAQVKRKTHSITSARAELVRKQQEKKRNRAILDSSSEEEDDEEDQRVNRFASATALGRSPPVAQDDKSSMGSVSSPGTPDYSQTLAEQTSPDKANVTSTFNFSDESDDGGEALEPLEEHTNGASQNEFIQPEGDASCLPVDMVDRTRHLTYAELAPFFEETADNLENEKLPEARGRVKELENALEGLDAMSAESRDALFKSW